MTAKEKILQAADQLFGEVGFDATSTREIAELSGVNKALIHYHFKSKEALLEHLLDAYYDDLTDTLRNCLSAEGTLRDNLLVLLDVYMDFLAKNRNFSRIVQREAAGGKMMDRVVANMTPILAMGLAQLRDAYPGTRRGAMNAEQLLVSFYGMIVGYFTYSGVIRHMLSSDPMSKTNMRARKKHLRALADIVLAAVEAGNSG
ncbi:MAG TPA: TetR/AcrR family transcriptional regulator [bacterium]|nr:TetR/AcrR family transcriptional regulator [bacterium]